jgi:ABC-type transport system involved in cytochrome bd biosynthesis fused ATPase/permease subunit
VKEVLRLRPARQAALAVALGTVTVLSAVGLLAASGALLSGAAEQPSRCCC